MGKTRRQVLLIIVVLVIGIGGAVMLVKFKKKPVMKRMVSEPPVVRVLTAEYQNVVLKVHTQGTVLPRSEITFSPEVGGRVIAVSSKLQAGGFFNQGEVLFTIDPRDYEFAVANARTQVARAEIALTMQEAEHVIVQEEWDELGEGQASPLVLHEPQLAEARVNLEAARVALEQAQRNLARTKVKAPFTGRSQSKSVNVGQLVIPGTPAARIYATDYAEIRLPLSLSEFKYLDLPLDFNEAQHETKGPAVIIKGDIGGQEHTWSGRVVRTEGQIDPKSRMIYLVAEVAKPYSQPDKPPLAMGLFIHAEITGAHLKDVFILPRSVLRLDNQVLVVDEANRLRFTPVEVYRAELKRIIISGGLKPGQQICLTPLETVVEGMRVRLMDDTISEEVTKE